MTLLTTALDTALAAPRALIFGAVEIAIPSLSTPLRLVDGSAVITFLGRTFYGIDPVFGVLAAIDHIQDGTGDQAPEVRINLMPPSATAAATLANPAMQGSAVNIWVGVVTPATGLVVADPTLVFSGEVDTATLKGGSKGAELELAVVSVFERFFDIEEGARLSDGYHQALWPGELGLQFATGVQKTIYWGQDTPAGGAGNYGGSFLGQRGGTGGFGNFGSYGFRQPPS